MGRKSEGVMEDRNNNNAKIAISSQVTGRRTLP